MSAANPIPWLVVSLKEKSSSPPTITAKVTNMNPHPVTFANYQTPLDKLALQTGLLDLATAAGPITYPTIQLKRAWPAPDEDIVSLGPGESATNDIELTDPPVPLNYLGQGEAHHQGKVQLIMLKLRGRWMGVLPKAKKDVSTEDWDGDASFSGDYDSPLLEMATHESRMPAKGPMNKWGLDQ